MSRKMISKRIGGVVVVVFGMMVRLIMDDRVTPKCI
jgi:hypothetical protein